MAEQAKTFWGASRENDIAGRCVRIGRESPESTARNYHWAIDRRAGDYSVRDFWSEDLWTTERYRSEGGPRAGSPEAARR